MADTPPLYIMNPSAARRAEDRVYKLIVQAVRILRRQGWDANALRFTPPEHLKGTAGGDGGFVLGVRVEVPLGDPRIAWEPSEDGSEGSIRAAHFQSNRTSDGRGVVLLSGIDDGSGSSIHAFIDRLQGRSEVEQVLLAAEDHPRMRG